MKRIFIPATFLVLIILACSLGGLSGNGSTSSQKTPPAVTESRCSDNPCGVPENPGNCPGDCAETLTPTKMPTATTSRPTGSQPAVLNLGIMVHLEGWDDQGNQAEFERHARLMREYATLFETYGARLTWESKQVTDGALKWGDNILLEMEQRGHGIGVHADIGGQRNYECKRFADDLRAEKVKLESLGVTVRHVSGNTSHCDWVKASVDAGYLFTTGQVAYSVMSMPVEKRPAEFRDCKNPGACHDVFPVELADRIHPWRMNSGADWLTPDPKGKLVMLAGSGLLPCQEEGVSGQGACKDFTAADVDSLLKELDQAVALAEPGKVNIYYVAWSLGKSLDAQLLETWLKRIVPYVEAGEVAWKTLPQMYDAYVQWEATQPTAQQ